MSIKIITNNVPRNLLSWYELTDTEKSEFDYCDDESDFVRYRGELIPICDFMRAPVLFPGNWDGYRQDSYFSAVVIRYEKIDDVIYYDSVICGLMLS